MKKLISILLACIAALPAFALDGVPAGPVQWYVNSSTGSIIGYRNQITSHDTATFDSLVFTTPTLTSPVINGTVTTTGLTLPAFAMGGAISNASNYAANFGSGALTAGAGTFSGNLTLTGANSSVLAGTVAGFAQFGNSGATTYGIAYGASVPAVGDTYEIYTAGAKRVAVSAASTDITGAFSATGAVTLDTGAASSVVTIGSAEGNYNGVINFLTNNTAYNWQLGSLSQITNAFTITPSTAGGGSTFTTPIVTVKTTGTTLAGDLTLTTVAASTTAPTLASGGCTTPSAVTANGTARFSLTVGTGCAGSQPLVFTLPATTTGWNCYARNVTNGATSAPAQTGATSTTSVTITNFVRTTGVAGAWTDSDEVVVSCLGG